jgi:hypothetical protein
VATSGDNPGAGVEPDTVVAHVRGERLAQTLDRVRRGGGIQPLQDLVGAREAAGPVEGGGDVRTVVDRFVDVDLEPDFDLFIEALKTLRGISRFWTEVEAGYGTFDDFPDPDLDEVINGRVALLDLCIRAYGVALTE